MLTTVKKLLTPGAGTAGTMMANKMRRDLAAKNRNITVDIINVNEWEKIKIKYTSEINY